MVFIHPAITDQLLEAVRRQYSLEPEGIHGLCHWEQVERNALFIAEKEGVESHVFSLFALFHDACRLNDGRDPRHGERGAALARLFHGEYYQLPADDLERLCFACSNHTHRTHHADPVIGICWDADRLDLPRVGIVPKARYLNTETARSKLR